MRGNNIATVDTSKHGRTHQTAARSRLRS